MISTQYINLNMVPSGVMPVLHCSQYDVGRPLGVVIYNGSESVDLSGYTVTIEGTRTDRTPVTAGVITDGNIGVFTTTPTMTNENDTYRAKVVLTDNAGRVSSLAFVMCVDEKTMDENAEEIEEDASIYQQYTGTVQTIIAQIRGDLAAEITARQNAISAEASARQAADNTLQSNINAETSTRATQDASLQSQINQLIAPSGSAPSAAEVENARIGSDGTVYPTLGDAIRTQNSLLKSQITHYHVDGSDVDGFARSMLIIDTNVWSLKLGKHLLIPISGVSKVYLTANNNNPCIYAFLTTDESVFESAPPFASGTTRSSLSANRSVTVAVPADANYLYLHYYFENTNYLPAEILFDGEDWLKPLWQNIRDCRPVVDALDLLRFGLRKTYQQFTHPNILNASLQYASSSASHLLIPISGVKTLTLVGGSQTTYIAFLQDENLGTGLSPVFTYQRTVSIRNGEVITEIVESDGVPVERKERIQITAGYKYTFTVPEEAKYLYIYAALGSTTYDAYWPGYIALDDNVILDNGVNRADRHMVLFDDFNDTTLSPMWKKIQTDVESLPNHYSRYYTDSEDCYVDSGILVLKCMKDPDMDLGHADVKNPQGEVIGQVEREYKAAYISSEDSFAIRKGAISARIKCSVPLTAGFPFTFFTFGQGDIWPNAPEFDIVEAVCTQLSQQTTGQATGTVYPAGTKRSAITSGIHYRNGQGEAMHYLTNYQAYLGDNMEYTSLSEPFNTPPDMASYDTTEWHIYKVEFDENRTIFLIDDTVVYTVATGSLNHIGNFDCPKDIRVNIKASPFATADEASLLVDWIKVESFDEAQAQTGVYHANVTMTVGDVTYIDASKLPTDATNAQFSMTTEDTDIIEITEYLPNYNMMYHRITALSAGTATVKLTAAGGNVVGEFSVTVS